MAETKIKAAVAKAGQAQPKAVDSSGDESLVGNRLAEMINELFEYALQQNLRPALDRLGRDFEQQIAEAKTNAIAEAREEIENHFNAFQSRLEIRSLDVATKSEQAMDKKVTESNEAIRQSIELQQQESSQKFSDAIRVRLMQMVVAEEDRLRNETAEAVKQSMAGLQDNLTLELAKFTERVRDRGEEMSDRSLKKLKEVESELGERLKRFEEIGTKVTSQLESRAELVMEQATTGLNKQMEDATTRVHQSFMRHIVTELSGKQTQFVQDAMKPLEEASEQNLKRMRKELSRMVKEVGQRFVSGGEAED